MTLPSEVDKPLYFHLVEIRNRMLKICSAFLFVFALLFVFSTEVFEFLFSSLNEVFTLSPLLTPNKLALILSILSIVPFVIYQLLAFFLPDLALVNEGFKTVVMIVSLVYYGSLFFLITTI
ncbi:twin-arginine translocase subunit TatC [Photobacterium iliopiscarium]|uniref:twin-arginine translocase subunit TatC n=2 Tax=Photobacterium iliopiscarium TaxID=56192 RepID=UPI001E5EF82B|nr:twin-arginine translocase subunit TatC [Photobacterium iliopiscarium]MCD9466837.1 hypothetical protein [Photobacterium iliopiscarium]